MMPRIDMTGKRFGRLFVLECANHSNRHGHLLWWCRCDCGHVCLAAGPWLRAGTVVSCGCYKRERARQAWHTHVARVGLAAACETQRRSSRARFEDTRVAGADGRGRQTRRRAATSQPAGGSHESPPSTMNGLIQLASRDAMSARKAFLATLPGGGTI